MDNFKKITLQVEGMTCVGCENTIESKLRKTSGVISAKASYTKNTVKINYHYDVVSLREIKKTIEKLNYKVIDDTKTDRTLNNKSLGTSEKLNEILTIAVVLFVLYMIANKFGLLNLFNSFPQAKEGMGYGVLFVIGLLTSVHCVAMCGGINLSQCVPQSFNSDLNDEKANLRPSFLYNAGRVISYTIIGGLVGELGTLVSFSGQAKGIVAIAASIFMLIMGINMLNLFPVLRKFNPRMPKIFARMIGNEKASNRNRPFYVGLLNGLMPCGPLQAMQLYALSTQDPIKGALSMLVFSLGTVPLMFGLGALSSLLSKRFTAKMMQVSAVLVIVLGFAMFQTGMAVSGFQLPSLSISNLLNLNGSSKDYETVVENGIQIVNSEVYSGSYEAITVKVGIPVKWTIHVGEGQLNGCNYIFEIKDLGIEYQLSEGDNVIEFTPTKSGELSYNCWMGMIRSSVTVVA